MRNHDTKNTEAPITASGPPDAPALVLIHGLAGSAAWWDPVVPALARAHRVLRVDLPGHGRSARPPRGGDDIPAQARRVAAALDGLGVDRAAVAGHSTGGLVGTALAEQRPDLVGALALINTGPSPDAHLPQPFPARLVTAPIVGRWMWRVRNDAAIRRGLDTAVAPGTTATAQKSLDYLGGRELTARLAQLTAPLMVIFGTRDRRRQPFPAERYRVVPGLRLELLPGVGHTPMLESPTRTAELLLAFTSSLRRAAG
ncbi:alpha/beta fold hydrolase [Streptomyces sp. NRRL S-920]|uniref:alpha/beta fold hydrolase n=1 Tax=Streptomyces sp. NRRL S-920 TaxID=1463921 RepID=UPI00056A1048|nr:alpha/beta fold hydrolase [Streptomyces sp. NRRL S-920]